MTDEVKGEKSGNSILAPVEVHAPIAGSPHENHEHLTGSSKRKREATPNKSSYCGGLLAVGFGLYGPRGFGESV